MTVTMNMVRQIDDCGSNSIGPVCYFTLSDGRRGPVQLADVDPSTDITDLFIYTILTNIRARGVVPLSPREGDAFDYDALHARFSTTTPMPAAFITQTLTAFFGGGASDAIQG